MNATNRPLPVLVASALLGVLALLHVVSAFFPRFGVWLGPVVFQLVLAACFAALAAGVWALRAWAAAAAGVLQLVYLSVVFTALFAEGSTMAPLLLVAISVGIIAALLAPASRHAFRAARGIA